MRSAAFAFGFALAFGLVAYVFLAWLAPELVPTSYLNVVGLVALVGALVGRAVATRKRPAANGEPRREA